MIKVSVLYPAGDDVTFDVDYYRQTHFADIVARTIKPARWDVEIGVDGPYTAIGNLYFDSLEAMEASMANGEEALADLPNFTNATPTMQVSRLVD
ncbi:EthD family reductase [Ilumatobacter sp.]|uniref:EthD family reductase n=1 Tax=Ilumatobacter sp. TaxID=1967498 RepID=UPI003B516AAB